MSKQAATMKPSPNPQEIIPQIQHAISGQEIQSALKATVKLLRHSSDHYDWVGIYLVKGEMLELAAYDGEYETEHVRIPIGQGICGSAAKEGHTILVPDVNSDPRCLACFVSTRSEIVVPILGKDSVLGEINIDSDRLSAFNLEDQKSLGAIAQMLGPRIRRIVILGGNCPNIVATSRHPSRNIDTVPPVAHPLK